mgnify:CR=1 FL=1
MDTTKEARVLRRFSQLWLSASEWDEPIVVRKDGILIAWIVDRKRKKVE